MLLKDKICIITGAAQGIGKAIAVAFAAEGAKLVVTDIDQAHGEALASQIGGTFRFLDVGVEDDWLALECDVPQADIVVNNAGITGFEGGTVAHDPENTTLEEWNRVHRINLGGTFLGCRYAIRAMKAKGTGSIINMSSRSGLVGIPGAAAYASSKAAIRNHSKSVALYCAQKGWKIRCNSVHPAAVLTPIWDAMIGNGPDREAKMTSFVADTPLKRFGTVEEVAALCVYLASDQSAYMTGSELQLDGGLLAGSAAGPGD